MTAFIPNAFKSAGYGRNVWEAIETLPNGTKVSDLLRPESWAHKAREMKAYDEVIVIPQGAPYRAHLLVMSAGKNFAKVKLLDVLALNAAESDIGLIDEAPQSAPTLDDKAPVIVKWNGPKDKYTVLRKSDGEKLRPGFATREEAEAWGATHLLAMA